MTVKDILLDRIKDKLYDKLHKQLKGEQLRGWSVDYVNDMVEAIMEDNEEQVDKLIDEQIKKLIDENKKIAEENKKSTEKKVPRPLQSLEHLNIMVDEIVNTILSPEFALRKPDHMQTIPSAGAFSGEFPFTARSLLQTCWGMTLNLSHDTQQQALGAMFSAQFDQLSQIFTPKLMTNISDSNGNFMLNLKMALSSSVRNLGFIRETHMEYIRCNADRLNSRRQAFEQIADFASFSGSGLYAKVGSFFAAGSLADLVAFFNKLGLSAIYIPIFLMVGIAAAFIITISARVIVDWKDDTWDWKTRKDQNRYWKEHYKKDATNELYNLYLSIKELIVKFYPTGTAATIIGNDELLKLSEETKVKKVIREQILVTDDLQWFPAVQVSQTSTQPAPSQASNQTQTSQAASKSKSTTSNES
jgi:hypothetical protein